MEDITKLLSASVTTTDYVVRKITENSSQYILPERIDLSKIDYEALAKDFKTGNQAIKYDRLRGQVAKRMQHMLRRNKNKKRIDYQDKNRTNDRRVQPGKCKSGDTLLQLLQFIKNWEKKMSVMSGKPDRRRAGTLRHNSTPKTSF